uniref:hypothetical protein n=1 Tax=Xanthomonas albilineans TaxID=29447 RepID=UPI0027DB3347|nr:hypothetical protein [Xanthomonas albilineans]
MKAPFKFWTMLKSAAYLSQEFTLWLPGLVVLTVLGWIVLGALGRVGPDAIAALLEVPVMCTYAMAALGMSWLIKRLYLYDLDRADECTLQSLALAGDAGARWVLIKDRLETLACITAMLIFFYPAR